MSEGRYAIAFINRAAAKEYLALDGHTRKLVDNGLARLAERAGEIGKPLSGALAGCKELKFRSDGIRIVFRIVDGVVEVVEIVAIGRRDKGKVFSVASRRLGNAAESVLFDPKD